MGRPVFPALRSYRPSRIGSAVVLCGLFFELACPLGASSPRDPTGRGQGAIFAGLVNPSFLLTQDDSANQTDPILLQPYLDRTPLGDGLEVLPLPGPSGSLLVPLGEICRLLGFGIQVDGDVARGFFIHERRRFLLEVARQQVEVDGRSLPVPPEKLRRQGREIYVEARLLETWFPLKVEIDTRGAALVITATTRLPIQDIWERENRYGNEGLRRYGDGGEGPGGRWLPTPYHFWDLPFAEVSLAASRHKGSEGTAVQGTLALEGDLLWMSSSFFGNRDQDGRWHQARGTLFREDPEGRLLGPLHARRVAMGDLLHTPSLDLVGSLPLGRGISLDNFPTAYRTRFATRNFRGRLPEGWSVELYQNTGLVGFQQGRSDGLYAFDEVPLRFGLNLFKLVFHGPQGQLRQETFRLDISQDQPPPGAFHYGLAYVRPRLDERLALPGEQNPLSTGPSSALPTSEEEAALQRPSFLATAEYGLGAALALQGGLSRMPQTDGDHTYTTLGLRGLWPYLSIQMNAARDQRPRLRAPAGVLDPGPTQEPGLAAEAALSTGLGHASLTLRRAEYRRGFQRSQAGTFSLGLPGQVLRTSSGLDLNLLGSVGRVPLSLTAQGTEERFLDGQRALRASANLSMRLGRVNLANSLTRSRNPGDLVAPLDGVLMVTTFGRRFGFQGDLSYQRLAGQTTLRGWGGQMELRTSGGFQFRLGAQGSRALQGEKSISYTGGLLKSLGRFGLGLDLHKGPQSYSALLRLQLSVGRDPRSGSWVTDASTFMGYGAVSATAFLDANGNGLQDPSEPTLEDTRFKVGGTETPSRIRDSKGAFTTHLPRGQEVDVSLDEASLDDPSQKATVRAFRILPRPGKVARLAFPVSTFGEVTGTTRLRRTPRREMGLAEAPLTEELPGLELELLDGKGRRVKTLRSAYDGYFEIRDLPHGDYLLRVSPEEVERVKLRPPEPRRFRIEAQRTVLDGLDVVVEPLSAPDPGPSASDVLPAPIHPTPTQVFPGKPGSKKPAAQKKRAPKEIP